LSLNIEPLQATATLNGTIVSHANNKLKPGKYSLSVKADGYISQTKSFTITSGKTTSIKLILAQNTLNNRVKQTLESGVFKSYVDGNTTTTNGDDSTGSSSDTSDNSTGDSNTNQATNSTTNGGNGVTVLHSESLYNGAWIVATVQTNSDPVQVVLKQTGSGAYQTYLGPGTSFDPNDVNTLPPGVQTALKNNMSNE
jgi:hypothetical protein